VPQSSAKQVHIQQPVELQKSKFRIS